MTDLHKQSDQWDVAMQDCPTMYCGRLDMATWSLETLAPQKMVYFDGEDDRVVCEGRRCDFVAYAANRYQPLMQDNARLTRELAEALAERDRYLAEINEADECRKWATEVLETVKKERDSARDENAKLREADAAHQRAAAYWWVQYYAAKGMSAPTPCSTDSAWEKVLEGACKAEQENAKLREELARRNTVDAAWRRIIERLESELSALRATAPYRVEQQQPAEVEQGEWRIG